MNELVAKIRAYLAQRSARERWMLAVAVAVVGVFLSYLVVVAPLARYTETQRRLADRLDNDLMKARQLAYEVLSVRGDVQALEATIQTSAGTNLLAQVETLAQRSGIRDKIESIKPASVSGNDRYPETKMTVTVRGATLDQTIRFLHAIESSPTHLIMRSLQIRKARGDGETPVLDVTLSVSSFERAA